MKTPGSQKPSLTLVVAVYNGLRSLELLFLALDRQSMRDFELIVADDGSGPDVGALVEARRRTATYPITHLWHPDQGFRKNVMLNQAIVTAGTDYMVFTDGDCIPHQHFLSDHWTHRGEKVVLCGRRVNLGPSMTEKITRSSVSDGSFERLSMSLLLDGLRGRSVNIEDGVRTKNSLLRKILHPGEPGILGCNFSVHRAMLERINGFNEEYVSPGLGEDSDVAFRLGLAGATLRSLRNLAILFHLYHQPTSVGEENKKIYQRVISAGEMTCLNGLRKQEGATHAS